MKVAVYGTLKQGHGNHDHFLRGKTIVGNDQIKGFTMYSLGGFPACVPSDDEDSRVIVEVYEVNDQELDALDGLEGYPRLYNRQEVETCCGTAWMYYMDTPPVHAPVVEGGCW